MDPQEQLPIKSKVPVFACPGSFSGVPGVWYRGREETHFSSGRVDLESFPAQDTVPLRIVEVDLSTLESLQAATYPVTQTHQWTDANHHTVFVQLQSVAEIIHPLHILVVAIGRASHRPSEPQASIGHPDPIGERDQRALGKRATSEPCPS